MGPVQQRHVVLDGQAGDQAGGFVGGPLAGSDLPQRAG